MIIKILIGMVIYFLVVALFCIFLKGATKTANEFEERQEALRFLKEHNMNEQK
jgi:uncharacterized membrane protein